MTEATILAPKGGNTAVEPDRENDTFISMDSQ